MNKDDNNPFNNFDMGNMMKMWSENPFVKSLMNNEFVQKITKGDTSGFDVDEIIKAQKKNLEALKSINEKAADSLGKLAEQQSKMMADAMEGLKTSNLSQTANGKVEEAQEVFKRAVDSMTMIGDVVKDAGEGMLEVVSSRIKDSMIELEKLIENFKK